MPNYLTVQQAAEMMDVSHDYALGVFSALRWAGRGGIEEIRGELMIAPEQVSTFLNSQRSPVLEDQEKIEGSSEVLRMVQRCSNAVLQVPSISMEEIASGMKTMAIASSQSSTALEEAVGTARRTGDFSHARDALGRAHGDAGTASGYAVALLEYLDHEIPEQIQALEER